MNRRAAGVLVGVCCVGLGLAADAPLAPPAVPPAAVQPAARPAVPAPGSLAAISIYWDGILAMINGDVVTAFDLINLTARNEERLRRSYADVGQPSALADFRQEVYESRRRAIESMIDQELLYDHFNSKHYTVPAIAVDKEIDEVVANQYGGSWDRFEEALEKVGMTRASHREKVSKAVAVRLLITQEIDQRIIVTPQEVRAYHQAHPEEFTADSRYRLAVILVTAKAGDHDARLAQARAALGRNEDFAAVARQYSDAPFRDTGGDLGWAQTGDVRQEFRSAIAGKKKGEWVGPVRLGDSDFLIQVADLETAKVKELATVYDEAYRKLFAKEKQRRYENFLGRLRRESFIRRQYLDDVAKADGN